MSVSGWIPEKPYDSLPELPPDCDLETKSILRRCIGARAALAELKQAAELIPNQAMLINTLPVLEARDSSAVENIITTTDNLFRHLNAAGSADPATKEALRYRMALSEGGRMLDRPLGTRTAEKICTMIRGVEMRVRKVPGVKLLNEGTGRIVYSPPEGEALIREKLADWAVFLNGAEHLDPLIRLAVGHYQFEAIHPFTDGNGRTGRVLNSLFLMQEGLLTLPILYLSRYIIAHKEEYYRLLLDVTRDDAWEPWILYMLQAVEETSNWTIGKIAAIRELLERTVEMVREGAPKIYSRELVELLFVQPYCRIANVVEAGIVKRQAASSYLQKLVEIGVLEERLVGREKLFVNPGLMGVFGG